MWVIRLYISDTPDITRRCLSVHRLRTHIYSSILAILRRVRLWDSRSSGYSAE